MDTGQWKVAPLPALPGAALAAGAIETTEATHYGRPEKHGGKPTNDSPRLRPTLRLSIPLEGLVYAPSSGRSIAGTSPY